MSRRAPSAGLSPISAGLHWQTPTVSVDETGQTTTTDAAGAYTVSNLSANSYNLTVTRSGYENATASVTVTPQTTTIQNFSLAPITALDDLVSVWDRHRLPLRANLSAATTVVDNAQTVLTNADGESVAANRDQLGVFDPGPIPLSVSTEDVSGPDDTYADENVTLIVGHSNSTLSQARNFVSIAGLDNETLAELNDNVTFERVTLPQAALDSNGEMDGITYDADPGEVHCGHGHSRLHG
ncbi:MAG: carboxypeptidase regulatory-like domain-containing protein [Natrialbaceae archaeon]|nr:carboxypeptidase regulatory-like domain-containing protein [Natrialbaceae archaeon]